MATIKNFKGINNVNAPERLDDAELRAAKNVDLDRTGRMTRRDGYFLIYSGTNVHSLWSNQTVTLFVEDGVLKSLDDDNNVTIIRSDAKRFGPMHYASVENEIYYSDGVITGIYTADGNSKPLGLPTPPTRPALVSATGTLPAGQYGVAITVADSNGMESGATLQTIIELPDDNSGITVSGLNTVTPDATWINIYTTNADGDTLYLAMQVSNGASNATITHPPQGEVLRTQFLEAMPAGNHIAYHKGRTLLARNNMLFFSEPFSPLTRLTHSFVPFSGRINMIAPVEDGFFISIENGKTYHCFGTDPKDWSFTEKANYAAIEGTAVLIDPELLPGEYREEGWLWLSEKGICLGVAGGGFQNLTSKRYANVSSSLGTAIMRQIDGRNQYVSTVHPDNGEASNIYFSDVATAEIRRNGVIIT